jgi:hypothetical protein
MSSNKQPLTTRLDAESLRELARLHKLWGIPKAQAIERCILIVGSMCRTSSCKSMAPMAEERRAEVALIIARNERAAHDAQ